MKEAHTSSSAPSSPFGIPAGATWALAHVPSPDISLFLNGHDRNGLNRALQKPGGSRPEVAKAGNDEDFWLDKMLKRSPILTHFAHTCCGEFKISIHS